MFKKLPINLDKIKDYDEAKLQINEWLDEHYSQLICAGYYLDMLITWKKEYDNYPYKLNTKCQKIINDEFEKTYNELPDFAKWRDE